MSDFHVASEEDIKSGRTTDVYFDRTEEVLKGEDLTDTNVVAEVTSGSLPRDWPWGVLSGLDEVGTLFENIPVCMVSSGRDYFQTFRF